MPASSNVLEFTRTLRLRWVGSCRKTCNRASWLNLAAQPAQVESDVSVRICSRDNLLHLLSRRVRLRRRGRFLAERAGIEPAPALASATTVLKTARATRHPSLSGKRKAESEPDWPFEKRKDYLSFLI